MNQFLKLGIAALAGIAATLAVGSVARSHMDKGLGHFAGADADGNGEITRAEWVNAANASFDKLDTNKDGKLIVGEIPREPRGGPGRHGHHRFGPDDFDGDDAATQAPAPAPAAQGNTAAPAAK